MRKTFIAAAAAFVIGGITAGAVVSQAQPAPPTEQMPPGPGPGAGMGPGDMGPQHRGMMGWHHRGRAFNPRAFALVYRQQDRQLAPADVQKIAEAFLLWNGNHTWKVTDVSPTPEGPVGFSLTTPEGSVVAKFTMDTHSGRITRVG